MCLRAGSWKAPNSQKRRAGCSDEVAQGHVDKLLEEFKTDNGDCIVFLATLPSYMEAGPLAEERAQSRAKPDTARHRVEEQAEEGSTKVQAKSQVQGAQTVTAICVRMIPYRCIGQR